jgi:hypothetical protein
MFFDLLAVGRMVERVSPIFNLRVAREKQFLTTDL